MPLHVPGGGGGSGGGGTKWYNSTTDPDMNAITANDGDYYFDGSNGVVYVWGSGAWNYYTNIMGQPGNDAQSIPLYDYIVDIEGDGDATTLGEVLAYAEAGSTIFIKSGIYNEDTTVITTDGITIIGENPDSTVLNYGPNQMTVHSDSDDVVFSNIRLDITNGKLTFSGTRNKILNCNIYQTGNSTITSLVVDGQYTRMSDCYIDMENQDTTPISYVQMVASFQDISDTTLVINANKVGLRVGDKMVNCTIRKRSAGTAVLVDLAAGGAKLVGCKIEEGNQACTLVRMTGYGTVCSNNSIVGGAIGIQAINAERGAISGNVMYDDKIAIDIQQNDMVVNGNFILGNTTGDPNYLGVRITAGASNCVVSANRIRDFYAGVSIVGAGSSKNLITSNQLVGNGSGIADTGTGTVTANNITA